MVESAFTAPMSVEQPSMLIEHAVDGEIIPQRP